MAELDPPFLNMNVETRPHQELPAEEYLTGERKFEYFFEFPDGKKFEAFQDEDGIGHIIIKRSEKVVFDASDFLPAGFKFVTPT